MYGYQVYIRLQIASGINMHIINKYSAKCIRIKYQNQRNMFSNLFFVYIRTYNKTETLGFSNPTTLNTACKSSTNKRI